MRRLVRTVLAAVAIGSAAGAVLAVRTKVEQRRVTHFEKVRTLTARGGAATAVAWSPDGTKLAAISKWGTVISVWDRAGTLLREMTREEGSGPYLETSLEMLSDNVSVVGLGPNSNASGVIPALGIWDSSTGELTRVVADYAPDRNGRTRRALVFALSPDRKLLAANTTAGTVTIYSTRTWEVVAHRSITAADTLGARGSIPADEPEFVQAFSFSRDGKRLAIGLIQGIALWDFQVSGQPLSFEVTSGGPQPPALSVLVYSPDEHLVAIGYANYSTISRPGGVEIRDTATRTVLVSDNRIGNVKSLSWARDGKRLAVVTEGGHLLLYEPGRSGAKLIANVQLVGAGWFGARFAPDRDEIAIGTSPEYTSPSVQIYRVVEGE